MPEETKPKTAAKTVTYADAGVDITGGDRAKDRIKYLAQKTFTRNVLGGIGGFGALYRLDLQKFKNPILVSSAALGAIGRTLQTLHALANHDIHPVAIVLMGDPDAFAAEQVSTHWLRHTTLTWGGTSATPSPAPGTPTLAATQAPRPPTSAPASVKLPPHWRHWPCPHTAWPAVQAVVVWFTAVLLVCDVDRLVVVACRCWAS